MLYSDTFLTSQTNDYLGEIAFKTFKIRCGPFEDYKKSGRQFYSGTSRLEDFKSRETNFTQEILQKLVYK